MSNNDNNNENNTTANTDEYEKVCYICRRSESKAGKMINMPGGLCVCADCMQKTFDTINNSDINYGDLMNNMPNMGMFGGFNMMGNDISNRQKVKKKKEDNNKPADKEKDDTLDLDNLPAPHQIKAMLDEYVIGQDYAKKVMSVAVYNHYKRVATGTMDDIEIEKSNMLMIGPTGSGKTYLVKTLARLLKVPLAITDATSLTEAGYIGDDIESVVSKLLQAADNDVEKAERGIIFIDEIDKITKKSENVSITRDVSGEGVQQALLKILEGTVASVPPQGGRKHPQQELIPIDTTNILFICGGAFDGLEKIIEARMDQSTIGFNSQIKDKTATEDVGEMFHKALPQDLIKFGLIPEFVGRVPVVVALDSLDEESLVRILREPKNAILKQYKALLSLDEVDLEFDDDAVKAIAHKSFERKTGARGLRSILEAVMNEVMYEVPSDETIARCTITKDAVMGTGKPVIEYRTDEVKKAQ